MAPPGERKSSQASLLAIDKQTDIVIAKSPVCEAGSKSGWQLHEQQVRKEVVWLINISNVKQFHFLSRSNVNQKLDIDCIDCSVRNMHMSIIVCVMLGNAPASGAWFTLTCVWYRPIICQISALYSSTWLCCLFNARVCFDRVVCF